MEQEVEKMQEMVLEMLRAGHEAMPLCNLVKDTCSEVSRLVGCSILEMYPECSVSVYKGVGLATLPAHDLLLIAHNGMYYIVDPTVWQRLPEHASILLFKTKDVGEVVSFLEKTYGGTWTCSENMTLACTNHKEEWLRTVRATQGS